MCPPRLRIPKVQSCVVKPAFFLLTACSAWALSARAAQPFTLVYEVAAPEPALFFGVDVAALRGDTDDDGVSDFVVGCGNTEWGAPVSAFLVSGATGAPLAEVVVGWGFGYVTGLGDVTGDGIPDWAGAWPRSHSQIDEAVSVFSGAARGSLGLESQLYEFQLAARLSVAGGNGRLVIGAGDGPEGNHVFFLSGANGQLQAQLIGPLLTGFGSSVANVGDWDGDGNDDYALGAPAGGNSAGRLYVVRGDVTTTGPTNVTTLPPGQLLATIDGPQPGDRLGAYGAHPAAALVGDLTGDGVSDLVAAAPFASTNNSVGNGSVLVYNIERSPEGTFSATLLHRRDGQQDWQGYGVAVGLAGDLDDDRVPDIAVSTGTPYDVCFYSGASFGQIGCEQGEALFAASLATLPDLENDTRVNLAVGAPAEAHPSSTGSVFVYNAGWTTLPGDLDRDGDVDLTDFLRFQQCYTGSGVQAPPDCRGADLDSDTDVDLADFTIFQLNFTGSR